MKNPFYFGNEVYDDDFCNRVAELQELKNDVASGLNILLYAPRRFGKTSLLKKLQNDLKKDQECVVIFFDLFSISTVEQFIEKYFSTIAHNLESSSDKILNLFKNILNIRPNITMKVGQSGDISYGLSFAKKEQENSFEDVINLPYQYSLKTGKKVVVIFDEFQEIEQLDIEKKLRTHIQTHSKNVSYIFSGSKKSILTSMFNDKNRAFYKSVKHNIIREISLDDWIIFAKEKFDKTKKEIENKQIKNIYDITKGYPYYMQQLLYMVWDNSSKKVDQKIIEKSLALMYEREYDLYAYMFSSLTPKQKLTLQYIVEFDGISLYANENLSSYNLTATTLKSTLEALLKKDICDKDKDKYFLVDPFMEYWLIKNSER